MTDLERAREEWREWTKEPFDWDKDFPPDWQAAQQHTEETAHTYIAALEAENEALKCCGNCIHGSLEDFSFMCCRENDDSVPADWWGDVHVADSCHFTPSRWQRRQP